LFAANGLSEISGLKLGTTQIYENGDFAVRIYPNPADDVLNIDFGKQQKISLLLTDVNGKAILNQRLTGLRNQLDISALGKGVYFLKLEGEGFLKIEKIIKQ